MAPSEPKHARNFNIVNKLNRHKCGDELITYLLSDIW
jgi:hypothetical protein